jgi:hypothetical protein
MSDRNLTRSLIHLHDLSVCEERCGLITDAAAFIDPSRQQSTDATSSGFVAIPFSISRERSVGAGRRGHFQAAHVQARATLHALAGIIHKCDMRGTQHSAFDDALQPGRIGVVVQGAWSRAASRFLSIMLMTCGHCLRCKAEYRAGSHPIVHRAV